MQFFESLNAMLKNNEHLSGWAQFLGAMIALGLTYFAANLPIWAAQRQERERMANLDASADRLLKASAQTVRRAELMLLAEGYGAENAQRVAYALAGGVDALERFPQHDLADQAAAESRAARLANMAPLMRDTMHTVQAHAHAMRSVPPPDDLAMAQSLENFMHVNVAVADAIANGKDPVRSGYMPGEH